MLTLSGLMKDLNLFFYRVKNRLWSRQAWLVLFRPLQTGTLGSGPEGVDFRRAEEGDFPAIARALPDELAGRLSLQKRQAMVAARFRSGVHCMVAVRQGSGEIIGGCWCRAVSKSSLLFRFFPGCSRVFEISTLFVTPVARGMNLGAILVNSACVAMGDEGYEGCVSLVWYTRPASIKTHLNVGFQPVGEKVTQSVVGVRRTWYRAGYRQKLIPPVGRSLA